MTTPDRRGVDTPHRLHVQYSKMFGGWLTTCPLCPAMVVRDNWVTAMNNANRHVAMHQHAPRRI